jgi:flagellar hook assembly protein FlgD
VAERPSAGSWQQSRFALEQNRPNPVVDGTTISYQLERPQAATLAVYDLAGNLVRVLEAGCQPAGPRHVFWDRTDAAHRQVAAGVYFCRLSADRTSASRKLVVR